MQIPRPLVGLVLFAALAAPVPAATLSFFVVETGSGGNPALPSARFESSSLWEDCLMDVFFEAGHIVSNSPILHAAQSGLKDFPGKESPQRIFPPEIRLELDDAAAGGADYFVLVLLVYPSGAAERTAPPEQVSLRIFSLRPYGFVYEGNSALNTVSGGKQPPSGARAREDERGQAKQLIRGLIPHLKD